MKRSPCLHLTPTPSGLNSFVLHLSCSLPSFSHNAASSSFWPFPPRSALCVAEKASVAWVKLSRQCRANFKAGVGGGGVHYAWPPTKLQRSEASVHISNTCSLNMATLCEHMCRICKGLTSGTEALICNVHTFIHRQIFIHRNAQQPPPVIHLLTPVTSFHRWVNSRCCSQYNKTIITQLLQRERSIEPYYPTNVLHHISNRITHTCMNLQKGGEIRWQLFMQSHLVKHNAVYSLTP